MYKKKQIYCCNCDKLGHEYKYCPDPVTSWGIILVKVGNFTNILHKHTHIKSHISNIKPKNLRELELISRNMNSIHFLMIRRKHSLGYIEFVRGRYKPDNVDGINFLFQQMVEEEIKKLGEEPFEKIWKDMWNNDEHKMTHMKKEYELSKEKFEQLKNGTDVDLKLDFYVQNVVPKYKTQEWGFPKGRRSKNESYIDCALREFNEETGIPLHKIKIIENISPIEENLIGTNGIKYRHIYYVAELLENIDAVTIDSGEIGDMALFNYNDAMSIIREYHVDKKDILTHLFMYYIDSLLCMNK